MSEVNQNGWSQTFPPSPGTYTVNVISGTVAARRHFGNHSLTGLTSNEILPKEFSLYQNYPNPFNPTTLLRFDVPKKANVTLKIFDVLGREVSTLVNKNLDAGRFSYEFKSNSLQSGIYFYRMTAEASDGSTFTSMKKMILMK